jgi:DNA polymerase-1
MRIFDTADLTETSMKSMTANEIACIYNGLDVAVTADIYTTLIAQLASEPENVKQTYAGSLAKLAPIMEMSMRGTLIDEYARQHSIRDLENTKRDLDRKFQRIMTEVFDCNVNWNSPMQLKNLFYGIMGCKEIKKRNTKGQYVPSVDKEALAAFEQYLYARPLAKMVGILRDLHKQIAFLKTEIDPDQRMRCNYNIAGTNTGRLNSTMSDFGTGTNLQNVNRALRYPFVADEGMYLLNIDLEQADGRNVGAVCHELFYDASREQIAKALRLKEWAGPIGAEFASTYLDACEAGDLHTTVCNMVWPEGLNGTPWPEAEDAWKKFCDGIIAHGQDSFRQLSKKGGHGTNYFGTPRTMAKHLHIKAKIIEGFQQRYFGQFPCISAWHGATIDQVEETGIVTSLFGRRRHFWGRAKDASTHRKAIAYCGQSPTGEQIDRGLLQIWREFPQVQLLNQVHDSILLQVPFSEVEELAPRILKVMEVTRTLKGGRQFTVPLDAAGGWNWGYQDPEKVTNYHGLTKWRGKEERAAPSVRKRSLKDYL